MASQPFLTIIVPMHNAQHKMGPCLDSLRDLDLEVAHEVIFVDDSSSDGTFERLLEESSDIDQWRVLRTEENSGTPSVGRNMGIDAARGEWLFFLDGDDAIRPRGINAAVDRALRDDVDIVRGSVDLHYVGVRELTIDRIRPEALVGDKLARVSAIAKHQSLTCMALIRRSLVVENGVQFDQAVRMGEDIVFTAELLTCASDVDYVDMPLFQYWRRQAGGNSAMHSLGSREVSELAHSWTRVEEFFRGLGLSYIELHGASTIGYALRQLIQHRREEISRDAFTQLAAFFSKYRDSVAALVIPERVESIIDALVCDDYIAFVHEIRPRMLIAGHDLKFIRDAEPELSSVFNIRYDEWPSERVHDVSESRAGAAWADVVWCEWLTACAVWYSNNVTPGTKLIVRVHRYELGRDYGFQINEASVSAFVTIAPHCYEDVVDRFGYARSKVRFIPNYYRTSDYLRGEGIERLKRLAMIGIAPRRKGYLAGLQVLNELRASGEDYTLSVLGRAPNEYPWIDSDPEERAYYAACESYIEDMGLREAVKFEGWVDTYTATKEFGFVLSMSEHEGSHVGPGEAFCAGNQGLFLPWRGVEYVYPEQFVFSTTSEMVHHIRSSQNLADFQVLAEKGRSYMVDTYDVSAFLDRVVDLWRSL
ncbi:glycosyltransferase [Oerskovia sp. Sa1BUA8]|uniref:Glycosyltransferase n=1 Tax=Oerskovia douganii TaxID=2762210 RepID=A0A9D5Z007_9CELL|nr:glycosyltransferase [Oerskovia douganii]MBE7701497.1 glycosyltransferase [Oerskovia douganii]